jgi:hypothetical protein
MRPDLPLFQPGNCDTIEQAMAAATKSPGASLRGFVVLTCAKDQYFEIAGPPKR